jgi:hypothetical protein
VSLTPKRDFRCEDDVWLPALAKARRLGTSISKVLRQKLREWLEEPEEES